jgi:hypothetical protein
MFFTMQKFPVVFLFLLLPFLSHAVEGMWLPSNIHRNIEEMQKMGFRLSASDLYSNEDTSIKDAVVRFGGGCTGSFISDQGLVITNHHCGFGQLQSHATVDNDYITHGFWATEQGEELACQGLTVTQLVRMENVTSLILDSIKPGLPEKDFLEAVEKASDKIALEAAQNGKYETTVNPFSYGNEYYLFVYKVFKDVRLVGAPPFSIGKFGQEDDNWMWPRHTGDFMLFRVYANAENQPSEYSVDNQPYQPEKFLPVNPETPKENDFTLVYGFPGTTQRYLVSDHVEYIIGKENPMGIDLRTRILDIYDGYMNASDTVRIQYISKYAGIANSWKRWIGQNIGLQKMDVITLKQQQEEDFAQWRAADPDRKQRYAGLMESFRKTLPDYLSYEFAYRLYVETALKVEVLRFAREFRTLKALVNQSEPDDEAIEKELEKLKSATVSFFRNYHAPIDRQVMAMVLNEYYSLSDEGMIPPVLEKSYQAHNGDMSAYADRLFSRSMLVSEEKIMEYLESFTPKRIRKLERDPVFELAEGIAGFVSTEVRAPRSESGLKVDSLYRVYTHALQLMDTENRYSPDANRTMRITYGRVEGSLPRDGMEYIPLTFTDGILEKAALPNASFYDIPERLKALLQNRSFGSYDENGQLAVNFLASNHTTGGNSGSPVLNGDGHFMGINFDRSWESTMSDILFDPDQCRNISVSAAYILWVIEHYADQGYLLDEMSIVR